MDRDLRNSPRVTLTELAPGARARLPVSRRELRELLEALLRASGEAFHIDAALADDGAMQRLNLQSTGLNAPTNVLSFSSASGHFCGAGSSAFSARMVLGVDALNREAFFYGQDPVEHLIRLAAHGMAHICGFDHGTAMDAVCEQFERIGADFFAAKVKKT